GEEGEIFGLVSTIPRQGLGSHLLTTFCQDLSKVTLEVGEDNLEALAFYHCHGFKIAGRRQKYYGEVDGLLLQKGL
ncbi:GNAT family N-acetyltransferase, partial [Staphylococcus aureus]